jgi:mannose-6-phosphate isomerase
MCSLYPLRFRPLFRRYLWGGRRLQSVLGKPIGDGDDYAESWEVVDHGPDQSVVAHGPLAGRTLGELTRTHGRELLGQHHRHDRFPLLFKFLDCNQNLSVQVHPDDERARQRVPPDRGKTEAWVILHADPGSVLYAGLRPGIDRPTLERAARDGTVADCLHRLNPRPGDCVFIPAGTAHALGAGLVVAEIQQASDITYRLFDWNRLRPDGRPRPLHVVEALEAIDHGRGPVAPQVPAATGRPDTERLVHCDKFVLERRRAAAPGPLGGDDRCHLIAVLEGAMHVSRDPCGTPLARGDVMLVPADCGPIELHPTAPATLLDVYLP